MDFQAILRKLLPGILLGFLALLALTLFADLRQVGEAFRAFNWRVLPFVLLLTLFNYALRYIKWNYYLGLVGVENLLHKESARIFVAGFPLAVTPGKVGEVLKGFWVEQKSGVPAARGMSVVLAERISDGMAVVVLALLGVIAYPQFWPAFLFAFLVLAGIILISQIRPLALWLLNLGARLPVISRFAVSLREFYEGSYLLFRPLPTLIAVSLGTISWLGEGLGFYLILLGLGVVPGWTTLSVAVFVLSFSILVGAVSALPGGLGLAEASIAGMLVLLLSLGSDTAAAATLLIRFATLWFGVSLGLMVWGFSRSLFKIKTRTADNQVA